jgi:predicted transcriptional regulator of viral defense system
LAKASGGRRFLTPQVVADALGTDHRAAAQKLARWASEGWLRRVRRGLYIPVPVDSPDPTSWAAPAWVVGNEVWAPCYFTGWTSANHWNLTEQAFRTTVLKTVARVRESETRLLDHNYLVSQTTESLMSWGLTKVWYEELQLKFADPSRTVIDILDSPRLGGGIRHAAEILLAHLETNDSKQLVEYGDRLGNGAVFKRLGYLVEVLGLSESSLSDACRDRITSGMSLLDPSAPNQGRYLRRWRIRVNVAIEPMEST